MENPFLDTETDSSNTNLQNLSSDSTNKNDQLLTFKKKSYNIEEIIDNCRNKDGIPLLNYICGIMHEKKRNILESIYKDLGKDYIIGIFEQTLTVENNGGLAKKMNLKQKKISDEQKEKEQINSNNNTNEKKSMGGIFFYLMNRNPEGKKILRKAAKLDYQEARERKKVYKLMNKLNIDNI